MEMGALLRMAPEYLLLGHSVRGGGGAPWAASYSAVRRASRSFVPSLVLTLRPFFESYGPAPVHRSVVRSVTTSACSHERSARGELGSLVVRHRLGGIRWFERWKRSGRRKRRARWNGRRARMVGECRSARTCKTRAGSERRELYARCVRVLCLPHHYVRNLGLPGE